MESMKKTITEGFLTCSICFEIFKDPKSLPCLHTFCHDCLRTFIEKSQTESHSCPVCREKFSLPTGEVSELKTNFCLKQMIEVIESSKPDVKRYCSFCILQYGHKEEAVSRCLTCNDLLCSVCARERHTFTRQTRHHRVVSLEEIASGKYVEEIQKFGNIPCDDHVDECIRFFCETCSLPICRECIILQHRNHEYLSPVEARKKREVEIKKLIISLTNRLKLLSQVKSEISTKSSELLSHHLKLTDEIEAKCHEAEARIEMCKKAAELNLKKQIKTQKEELERINNKRTKEYDVINESLSFCQQMLKNASDIQFLFIQDEMKVRLSMFDMQDIIEECPELEKPEVDIQFKEEFFEILVSEPTTKKCSLGTQARKGEKETLKSSELRQNVPNQISYRESSPGIKARKGEKETLKSSEMSQNVPNQISLIESSQNKMKEEQKPHSNEIRNTSLPFYFPKCLQSFGEKSKEDKTYTKYVSVSWINETVFAAVDQQNEVLKVIDIERLIVHRHLKKNVANVSSCMGGLSLKLLNGDLIIYKNAFDFNVNIRFTGIYGLAVSLEDAHGFVWTSKEKFYLYEEGTLSERRVIDETGIPYQFDRPFRVCCLPNGKFVVCDIAKECVYILKNDGRIFRKMFMHPGAVCSDTKNNIYIADYDESVIDVFDENGDPLHRICTKSAAIHPRAIAVSSSGKLLVANQENIAMFSISDLGKLVYMKT